MIGPAEYTEQREIIDVSHTRPHVVILGAGASYAAFPDGDANGRKLPLLKDFAEVLGLVEILKECGFMTPYTDFERIYTELCDRDDSRDHVRRINRQVYRYFSELRLPETPTMYDYIVLSLRDKDVIASFNWDPFLYQAIERNRSFAAMPKPLFLHGTVAVSLCNTCQILNNPENTNCIACGKNLQEMRLLYPVAKKDYNSDPAIEAHWKALELYLERAYAVTIFGYSAPSTDVEAVAMMKKGWGSAEERNMEQIDIVDILDNEILRRRWDEFIHTHHYEVVDDYYKSFISRHPRRSCEAYWAQLIECVFLKNFPIPKKVGFEQIYDYLMPRVMQERA